MEADFDLDQDTDVLKLDLTLEFYLKGREDPLSILTEYKIPMDYLKDSENPLEDLMESCETSILQIIDTRGEERYVFTDSRHNIRFVMASEVQSISLLAPDESNLLTILELAD